MAKTKAAKCTTRVRDGVGARPGLQRVTVYLSKELVVRLKVRAATDGGNLSSTVKAALEAFL